LFPGFDFLFKVFYNIDRLPKAFVVGCGLKKAIHNEQEDALMKNMSDKTKKRLVIGVSLAVCAVLVVLIGSRFMTEPQTDDPIPSQNSQPSDVTVDTDTEKNGEVVVSTPDVSDAVGTDSTTGSGADDNGTEQTIQPDVTKPEYTDEQLTDPSQKPNGEPTTESTPSTSSTVTSPSEGTSSSGSSNSGGGLPGFDNVPNLGENQGETIDGDGDINKQVGTMD
jgi:hypothetical protein